MFPLIRRPVLVVSPVFETSTITSWFPGVHKFLREKKPTYETTAQQASEERQPTRQAKSTAFLLATYHCVCVESSQSSVTRREALRAQNGLSEYLDSRTLRVYYSFKQRKVTAT